MEYMPGVRKVLAVNELHSSQPNPVQDTIYQLPARPARSCKADLITYGLLIISLKVSAFFLHE